VLCIRRYPEFPKDSAFVTGTASRHRIIHIGPIYDALRPLQAESLPGFHSFSGADVTASFADTGKLSCWQTFTTSGDYVKSAFASLGKDNELQDAVIDDIETYVCRLYQSQTHIVRVNALRWWLFSMKQAEAAD
jgi:hypothetical protein